MNITYGCNPFVDMLCEFVDFDLVTEESVVYGDCSSDDHVREKLAYDMWNNTCEPQFHSYNESCRLYDYDDCHFEVVWDECTTHIHTCSQHMWDGTVEDCEFWYENYWICNDYNVTEACAGENNTDNC